MARCFGDELPTGGPHAEFIAAVDAAYRENDRERATLQHSLELSSRALVEVHESMRAVSERKRAEEERFRQLAENIDAVFWMRDADHQQIPVRQSGV